MRVCALLLVSVCLALLACLSCAQPSPSPPSPNDSFTILSYAATLNGTALGNGTVHAFEPIYCLAVNDVSVQLISRISLATDKPNYLEYRVTAQPFLYSTDCTGRPLPTVLGLIGEVPDVPSAGVALGYVFHSFEEPALNGLVIVGSINIEVLGHSSSSSSSTGAGPAPAPTPVPRFAWTLNYNYTYAGVPYLGTQYGDSVCTTIASNFSLLWSARASLEHGPDSGLLLNNTIHLFSDSLDCTGEGQHADSDFEVVEDKPSVITRAFKPEKDDLPAGLHIGSTYSLAIGPRPPTPPTPTPDVLVAVTLSALYSYPSLLRPVQASASGNWSVSQCTPVANFSVWSSLEVTRLSLKQLQYNASTVTFADSTTCNGQGILDAASSQISLIDLPLHSERMLATSEQKVTKTWGPLAIAAIPGLNSTSAFEVDVTDNTAPIYPSYSSSSSSTGGGAPDNGGGGGGSSGMSKGTKTLLIALGSSAGALALIAILFCVCRKKKVEQTSANYQTMAH